MASTESMLFRSVRIAGFLFAAAAGFFVTCLADARFFSTPDLPNTVREKVAHLSAHGNEYDAIFLGSSRIQNHVMPDRFDRSLIERGIPMKSFNFGIASMHAPEDDYVLDLILAQPHARLRWVFLEIDFFNTAVQRDQTGTLRGLYWHDWPRFALLCRRLAFAKEFGLRRNIRDVMDRSHDFLDHAQLFCVRSSNAGRGAGVLGDWLFHTGPASMDRGALGASGDGWIPATSSADDLEEKQSGRLGKMLIERTGKPPEKDEADPASQSILLTTLSKIVRAGALPVIVIPPRIRQVYYYPESAIASRVPIIDFCNPAKYPELYDPAVRVDRTHLNEAGALIFTRLLSARFLEVMGKN